MIVIEPGKMTAALSSPRSWLPWLQLETSEQVRSRRRMWYGEPLIATAELLAPQSARVAMCPPQARTTVWAFAWNNMLMLVWLFPEKVPDSVYALGLLLIVHG